MAYGLPMWDLTKTMAMLSCPLVPHSVFFLLMLYSSLVSTGNFLYQYSDWENYPGLDLDSRNFHHHEDQNPRHMWHRRNSNKKICQALPDLYFVIDKSDSMTQVWPHVYQFVVEMIRKLSNQDLRVSIITYSCKGNVILPITGDREEIFKGLERAKYSMPAGHALLYRGLFKVNEQIRKNVSGGVRRPSTVISLLSSPLESDAYQYTVEEADDIRKMEGDVFTVGVGTSASWQILKITGKLENAFTNKKYTELKDLVFPIISKICPYLKSADTSIICIGESRPVVLRGYGFDFVMNKEDIICRFYFNDIDMSVKDVKPINTTKDTATCPGPIVEQPGKVIYVLLSLDNGENFMNSHIFVASKLCGKTLPALKTTTIRAMRPMTKRTTRKTTSTTITTTPSTTTTRTTIITTPTTTTTTTTTLWMVTESHTTIPTYPLVAEELKPSIDKFIFAPILLGLMLSLLLFGCFWQLCCLPPVEELPPPKSQPQPRKKKLPPSPVSAPAPAPPVNPSPIVIVCCCTCRGLCVSRDVEGNVTVCNFNPQSCYQLPLMWPQSDDQGWYSGFALLKALCAESPCGPRANTLPSQECLPLASCSQCHQFPASCSGLPSRLQLLTPPSWAPRTPLSLPHM